MQNTINLPWVESPFFGKIIQEKKLSDYEKKLATEYNQNGFIVLSGLFEEADLNAVKKEMDAKGFNTQFAFKHHRDDRRVQDLWQVSEPVRKLACHPQVLQILEMLYGRDPIPFQTLNFRAGSQQRAHSDTIHFSSLPARYMCGVWVALEDITPNNGAVFYYPGSHKLPEYNFAHFKPSTNATSYEDYEQYENFIGELMEHSGIEKKPFYAKKGDALIWSSNIIHGGSKVNDPVSTRYSQVTHYYFKDCIYYTPMLSNMVTNELYLRNHLTDIRTGEEIKMTFNGAGIDYVKSEGHRFMLTNPSRKISKVFRMLGDALFRSRNK